MDSSYRLLKNVTHSTITRLYQDKVKKYGILAWPFDLTNPVSSLTHKKMFEYFHTDTECFLFLQMVKADVLLMINTEFVHHNVMLPWIQCALTQDCIAPIGAQSVGCKFDKKPLYRYSGCHSYDVSALNIALGLAFKQDSYTCCDGSQYTYSDSSNLFEIVSLSKAEAVLREFEQNSTTEGRSIPYET